MATRHEEKFIIDYKEYLRLRARAEGAMEVDPHAGEEGYLITSLYYDDRFDSALDEKLDGVRVHTKYRVRTYNSDPSFIRLERKVKRGIMTEKHTVRLEGTELPILCDPGRDLAVLNGRNAVMALEMRAKGLIPAVIVRYRRDAFVYPGTDTRLTFDTNVEALPPDYSLLFEEEHPGIPAMPRDQVIMEVKYGEYLPQFVRKISACCSKQLSVSKYAICREAWR